MGLIGGVLQPLYGGCSVTLMSPETFLQKPSRWLKAISDYKATTSGGPNFAYELCVQKITPQQRQQLDLSSWQVAFNGAEPVRAETIEKFSATFADCGFQKSAFYPCYGMAETTLIVSGGLKTAPPVIRFVQDKALKQNLIVTATSDEDDVREIVGVGHSSLDQKIAIANPESLTRCPNGEIGEILVAGPSVAGGYWKKPEETQQIFHAQLRDTKEGPFLRTGDLGFLLDGELFVTGRIKYLKIPLDEIDIQESFAAYGLDSAVVVSMTGELAQWIGCELGLTLLWEYPNIETLAQYLAVECQLPSSTTFPVVL